MGQLYEKTVWTLLQRDKRLFVLPQLDTQRLEKVDTGEQEACNSVYLYLRNALPYLQKITFCYSRNGAISWHRSLAERCEWEKASANSLPC